MHSNNWYQCQAVHPGTVSVSTTCWVEKMRIKVAPFQV
jgi:hypothetical protein